MNAHSDMLIKTVGKIKGDVMDSRVPTHAHDTLESQEGPWALARSSDCTKNCRQSLHKSQSMSKCAECADVKLLCFLTCVSDRCWLPPPRYEPKLPLCDN